MSDIADHLKHALQLKSSFQVSKRCEEQGMVLGAVWNSYTNLLEELLSQIRGQFSELQTRCSFRHKMQRSRILHARPSHASYREMTHALLRM